MARNRGNTAEADAPENAEGATTEEGTEQEHMEAATATIEFVDELPKISRDTGDGGVWIERLRPLTENAGRWARVYGPVKNPHPLVNNLKRGNAKGIDPTEFEFAGRSVDGKGYVFAMYLTDEQKQERANAEAEAEAATPAEETPAE